MAGAIGAFLAVLMAILPIFVFIGGKAAATFGLVAWRAVPIGAVIGLALPAAERWTGPRAAAYIAGTAAGTAAMLLSILGTFWLSRRLPFYHTVVWTAEWARIGSDTATDKVWAALLTTPRFWRFWIGAAFLPGLAGGVLAWRRYRRWTDRLR
jgi:hypothetical protein